MLLTVMPEIKARFLCGKSNNSKADKTRHKQHLPKKPNRLVLKATKMKIFEKIHQVVSQIPKGKVSTYKDVAIKSHTSARVVGFALHANQDSLNIPCHRVVKQDGSLAKGYAFGGKLAQKEKLKKEGVVFASDFQVDLSKCLCKV